MRLGKNALFSHREILMARKENISALAEMLGLVNDPVDGLREEDLTIARLDFYMVQGHFAGSVELSPQNKAGRLFFQQFANEGILDITLDNVFQVVAKTYFAELWEPEPNPARTLIHAIRTNDYVRIVLK